MEPECTRIVFCRVSWNQLNEIGTQLLNKWHSVKYNPSEDISPLHFLLLGCAPYTFSCRPSPSLSGTRGGVSPPHCQARGAGVLPLWAPALCQRFLCCLADSGPCLMSGWNYEWIICVALKVYSSSQMQGCCP